jgi:hypothetical protein
MVCGVIAGAIGILANLSNVWNLLGTGDPGGELVYAFARCAIFGGLIAWLAAGLSLRSSWPRWRKLRAVRAGFEISLGSSAVFLCLARLGGNLTFGYPANWPELSCLWVSGLVLVIVGIRAVAADERA